VVTEAATGKTNQNGPFTTASGKFVAQAGTFLNGPDLDKGPSNLALDHIFEIHGLVDLPWQFQISSIFRAQSGFHFSQFDELSRDPDGNGNFNGIDFTAGRNAFTAPPYVTVDMRFSKRFSIGERIRLELMLEFFNLLNHPNFDLPDNFLYPGEEALLVQRNFWKQNNVWRVHGRTLRQGGAGRDPSRRTAHHLNKTASAVVSGHAADIEGDFHDGSAVVLDD